MIERVKFAKLYVGDFSLNEAPELKRLIYDQIRKGIENNQHFETREAINVLKIYKLNFENHLLL